MVASTPQRLVLFAAEDSPSGLGRTLGKRVGGNPSRVRISYPPPVPHRAQRRRAPPLAVGPFAVLRLRCPSRFSSRSASRDARSTPPVCCATLLSLGPLMRMHRERIYAARSPLCDERHPAARPGRLYGANPALLDPDACGIKINVFPVQPERLARSSPDGSVGVVGGTGGVPGALRRPVEALKNVKASGSGGCAGLFQEDRRGSARHCLLVRRGSRRDDATPDDGQERAGRSQTTRMSTISSSRRHGRSIPCTTRQANGRNAG